MASSPVAVSRASSIEPVGDFEVELHGEELAADVVAARQEAAAADELIAAILQPRFDGHILASQTAIDALIDAHRQIVDRTDLDLDAETRPLAVWELAGRCLALATALLDQLRLGYGPETVGTMRVLHEAVNLLMVAVDEEEGRLSDAGYAASRSSSARRARRSGRSRSAWPPSPPSRALRSKATSRS
jgi:hypothetical protein